MATQGQNAAVPGATLDPATRRRLQKCYEHGCKNMESGNFDYATEMLQQCVAGDPGNLIYVQSYLANLHKKYNNNKKGSKLAGLKGGSFKSVIKKATANKDWVEVTKAGLELLKFNPWDFPTLSAMANACFHMGFVETQLAYLKSAIDANPKDPEINKQCGIALGRMGQFDQAIACWHRVEQAKPGDEEAQKAISELTLEKTRFLRGEAVLGVAPTLGAAASPATQQQRSPGALASNKSPAKSQAAEKPTPHTIPLTPEQQLEKAITAAPDELPNYLQLAELYTKAEKYDRAEHVLEKGLAASGGELKLRELLEDAQLRRAAQQLAIADKRAREMKTDAAADLHRRMRAEVNRVEMEVYRARSERYPNDLSLKFELGVRLKRAGNFQQAIDTLRATRDDPRFRGPAYLETGECYQQLKEYPLALSKYQKALAALPNEPPEPRRLVLYRAGVLATALKELELAEQYFKELQGIDPDYKDVAERLDKVAQLRHKG